MQLFHTAIFLAVALALVRGDVATIKTDVANIDAAVTSLNTQLASDNINYVTALGIDSAAKKLDTQVKQGTTDVGANTDPVTDADASDIITSLTATEKNVKSATDRLVVLKPQFDSLGVSGLAQTDINNLSTDTHAFGQALVAVTPTAEKDAATALAAKFDADLANAKAAYA
ncbi:hypothetical protein CBS101457_005560 [Exobasidium rhododendri]|nr:hypothetical protein CBS101457_005560 [Exobasidium rhododendri]